MHETKEVKPCPDVWHHVLLGIGGIVPCGPNCKFDRDRIAYEKGYLACMTDYGLDKKQNVVVQ